MSHFQLMAEIISTLSLKEARNPSNKNNTRFLEWCEGRAHAAQSICPTKVTVGAHNETRFMVQQYWPRHGG